MLRQPKKSKTTATFSNKVAKNEPPTLREVPVQILYDRAKYAPCERMNEMAEAVKRTA